MLGVLVPLDLTLRRCCRSGRFGDARQGRNDKQRVACAAAVTTPLEILSGVPSPFSGWQLFSLPARLVLAQWTRFKPCVHCLQVEIGYTLFVMLHLLRLSSRRVREMCRKSSAAGEPQGVSLCPRHLPRVSAVSSGFITAVVAEQLNLLLYVRCCMWSRRFTVVGHISAHDAWIACSSSGISMASLATEVSCYACTVAYGLRKGYALTIWGSEMVCWLQDATLLGLVAHLRGVRLPIAAAVSALWFAAQAVLFTDLVPMWFLSKFQVRSSTLPSSLNA
jgi:hypothetical protein